MSSLRHKKGTSSSYHLPDDELSKKIDLLYKWHLFAAAIHFVIGIICIVLIVGNFETNGRVPIVLSLFVRSHESELNSVDTIANKFPLLVLPLVFSWLACFDHLFVSLFANASYKRYLLQNLQPYRWIEYFFSAAVMNVLIVLLTGCNELIILVGVAALTSVTMIFGFLGDWVETIETEKKHSKTMFWAGCYPFAIVWFYIFYQFIAVTNNQGNPPWWVYLIVILLFVLESLFAAQQRRQISFVQKERGFVFLSLIAKVSLSLFTIGGIMSYQNN